ncbi:MAG: GNAT family N-acetyltransferase [Pseudomonadota bacterium]
MTMTSDAVAIAEEDDGAAELIEAELLKSLRLELPQSTNTSFVLTARDSEENLVGGLTASTSYGWLLVKTLWVKPSHRGKGLGQDLMAQAEAKALAAGCHGAWLDTSSPKARQFYERQGYEPFGQLSNEPGRAPEGHRRWFMQKAL